MSDICICYLPEDAGMAIELMRSIPRTRRKHPFTTDLFCINKKSFNNDYTNKVSADNIIVIFSLSFFNNFDLLKVLLDDVRPFLLVYSNHDYNSNNKFREFINGGFRVEQDGLFSSLVLLEETKAKDYLVLLRMNSSQSIKKTPRSSNKMFYIRPVFHCACFCILMLAALYFNVFGKIEDSLKSFSIFIFFLIIFWYIGTSFLEYLSDKKKEEIELKKEQTHFWSTLRDSLSKPIESMNLDSSSPQRGTEKNGSSLPQNFYGDEEYYPIGHLRLNWKELKEYYQMSKLQSSKSFRLSVGSCIAGILIIVFALLSPLIPAYSSEKNSLIPLIGGIAGAVAELVAGTSILVYGKTLSQANLYHEALSHYQNYLSCINLVEKITSEEKRNEVYEKIIAQEMEFSLDSGKKKKDKTTDDSEKPNKKDDNG